MISKIFYAFIIMQSSFLYVTAQNKLISDDADLSEITPEKSSFKISTSYLSNSIYQGRQSEDLLSLINTGVGYYHKSGFFVSGSFTYIPNVGYQQIDRKDISIGYNYNGEKLGISTYLAKYIYNDSSSQINAGIQSSAGVGINYNFDYVTVGAATDFNFASKSDIVFNANLSHSFSLANDNLLITPMINMNAGTENFYQSYFSPKKKGGTSGSTRATIKAAKHRRNNNTASPNTTNTNNTAASEVTILNSSAFKIMDYEIGIPIEYRLNKFLLSFIPTYVLPVNPSTISNNNIITTEVLKNAFVVELGVSFTF